MHAGVARQTLERARQIDEVFDLLLGVVELPELRLLRERILQCDAELERHELGDPVYITVAHPQHAAAVAHDGLRRHGAVGDDLRDALSPVLLRNVVDHAVAPVHAEVDIEVGHRDALRIQEALEQQVVLERIQIGDAQNISHQGARAGTAAGTDRHAILACPANEIGNDEEVSRKAHLADDIELGAQTFAIALGSRWTHDTGNPLVEAPRGLRAHEVLRRDLARHRVFRQPRLTQLQNQSAAARDLDRIRQCLGHIAEQFRHFLRRAQVLLMGVATHPTGVGEQGAVVDAHTRLMRFEVGFLQKADIVGRHDRHAPPTGERYGGSNIGFIFRTADALQLDVKAFRKQGEPEVESAFGVTLARIEQCAADIPLGGARQCDQTVEILGRQPIALDGGDAALLTFLVSAAHEARYIAVSGLRLAQQGDLGGLLTLAGLMNEQIDADDRLHPARKGCAIELHHREEIALVSHPHRRHAARGDRIDKLGHTYDAVDQRVLGMQTKMDEPLRHGRIIHESRLASNATRTGLNERLCRAEGSS